jgi:hypothetical protein
MARQFAHGTARSHAYACPTAYRWMTGLLSPPVAAPLTGSLLVGSQIASAPAAHAQAACTNPIEGENQLPRTPQSVWDLSSGEGVNDPTSVALGVTFTSDARGYAKADNPPIHAKWLPVSSGNLIARMNRGNFA